MSTDYLSASGQFWRKAQQAGFYRSARRATLSSTQLIRDPATGQLAAGRKAQEVWRSHFHALASPENNPHDTPWLRQVADGTAPCPVELPPEPSIARPISLEELNTAIRNLPRNKAPGSDTLPYEALKLLPDTSPPHPARTSLLSTLNGILRSGTVPQEWRQSVLVPIPKKAGSQEVADHRGIALMITALKVLLVILLHRARDYLEAQNLFIPEQLGFRQGRECVEQSFVLHEILHRRKNANQPTYLGFLDIKKRTTASQTARYCTNCAGPGCHQAY